MAGFKDIQALRAFRYESYRRFWLYALLNTTSYQMQFLARGYLAAQLTSSPLVVAVVFALTFLPLIFAPIVGGILADRYERRNLLLMSDMLQLTLAIAMAVTVIFDGMNVGVLMAFSLGAGIVMGIGTPIRQSMIGGVVGADSAGNGVVYYNATYYGMSVAAPSIAGFIIDGAGVAAALMAAVVAALLSLCFLLRTEGRPTDRRGHSGVGLEAIKEGIRFIGKTRLMTLNLVAVVLMALFGMPYLAALPLFQTEVLQVDASGLGLMFGALGLGAFTATLSLALVQRVLKPWQMLSFAIAQTVAIAAFSQSDVFSVSLLFLFSLGLGEGLFLTTNFMLFQYLTTDEMRGRVFAFRNLVWGLIPAGQLMMGAIAESTGPQPALLIMAIMAGTAMVGVLLCLYALGPKASITRTVKNPS